MGDASEEANSNKKGGGMIEKDKRISNDLDMSDSDEEDDGHGDKKKNNQNYKKRILEPTKPPTDSTTTTTTTTTGVHKSGDNDAQMDVTTKSETTETSDAAKVRKLDEETETKKQS